MIHSLRHFHLHAARDTAELAHAITQNNWPLCTAFLLDEYVFLNDAYCRDGEQHYAIVKLGCGWPVQVETVTFSWYTEQQADVILQRIISGEYDYLALPVEGVLYLDAPGDHRCPLCA